MPKKLWKPTLTSLLWPFSIKLAAFSLTAANSGSVPASSRSNSWCLFSWWRRKGSSSAMLVCVTSRSCSVTQPSTSPTYCRENCWDQLFFVVLSKFLIVWRCCTTGLLDCTGYSLMDCTGYRDFQNSFNMLGCINNFSTFTFYEFVRNLWSRRLLTTTEIK